MFFIQKIIKNINANIKIMCLVKIIFLFHCQYFIDENTQQ
jgi:hypothetical protein